MSRVLFHVQHLLGVGHIHRAVHVANALSHLGHDVLLVSGGMPVRNLPLDGPKLYQLDPMAARAGNFKDLVTDQGEPVDEAFQSARRHNLLSVTKDFMPDALITEAFPFGRRQLRFELIALLQTMATMTKRPIVIASVRDILQEAKKTERVMETLETLNRFYDHILVHGDKDFAVLEETFPHAQNINCPISYSGLVTGPPIATKSGLGDLDGVDEVLVSTGGGTAQSEKLFHAVLQAKPTTAAKDKIWRFLIGPNVPTDVKARLMAQAGPGIIVEHNRADFRDLLGRCALSISQAGYNTVGDILRAGCRSIVIPYANRGETEQSHRAIKLQDLGIARVISEETLSADSVRAAVNAAMASEPEPVTLNLEGAKQSAKLITGWLNPS